MTHASARNGALFPSVLLCLGCGVKLTLFVLAEIWWHLPTLFADVFFFLFISHQPAVFFSQNKPAIRNQLTVLFSQNKLALAISNQPNEHGVVCSTTLLSPTLPLAIASVRW
jgi:hypothetical protein